MNRETHVKPTWDRMGFPCEPNKKKGDVYLMCFGCTCETGRTSSQQLSPLSLLNFDGCKCSFFWVEDLVFWDSFWFEPWCGYCFWLSHFGLATYVTPWCGVQKLSYVVHGEPWAARKTELGETSNEQGPTIARNIRRSLTKRTGRRRKDEGTCDDTLVL